MKVGWALGARTDSGWGMTGLVSVALHVLVIAIATHRWLIRVKPMAPAGTARGSQRMLIYLPGHASSSFKAEKSVPVRVKAALTPAHQAVFHLRPAAEIAGATSGRQKETTAGNDALGTGSVNIAWVQGFPSGKPDLSKVAFGSPVDVVVDVQIDDTGRVARAKTKKGMGPGIDEVVVATVEQWIFYPAMRNGRPVASEQELHFHYERGRGAEPCGWDCFELASR